MSVHSDHDEATGLESPRRRDAVVLCAILGLAAALRFIGLPARGQWDDDQGGQLLTLLSWVRGGPVPLVGPPSSVEGAHHGAAFYWLMAPGAFASDASPVVAAATMASLGTVGVAATWWLGRIVGGPLSGHLAGLVMAVSPAAISASTFVWNANTVGPSAAIATAAAWKAVRTQHSRWWLLSAVGAVLLVHGHPLSIILVTAIGVLLVTDALRPEPRARRQAWGPAAGASLIVAAGVLPLIVSEARSDFAETRAIGAFLSGAAPAGGLPRPDDSPITVLPRIAWRVLVWPISGSDIEAPMAGVPAALTIAAGLVLAICGRPGTARQFGRWVGLTTLWSVIALAILVPGLGITVVGLPTDQYHAWLDPLLVAAFGVGAARLCATGYGLSRKAFAATLIVSTTLLALASLPPWTSGDGGWPTAARSADRIRSTTGDHLTAFTGVYKSGGALEFPSRRAYAPVTDPTVAKYLVVSCDPLFEPAVGARCGGPAEDAWAGLVGFPVGRLADRWVDSPRRVVSVFARR